MRTLEQRSAERVAQINQVIEALGEAIAVSRAVLARSRALSARVDEMLARQPPTG